MIPGSIVLREDDLTYVVKERGERAVTVRNTVEAKIGSKAKKDTSIQVFD